MYECCCVDYDEPTIYNVRERKARKEHKCCECGETIAKGSRYELVTGLYDGGWSTFKTCLPCVHIRNDFFQCGFLHEGLNEMLWDCYGIDLHGRIRDDD